MQSFSIQCIPKIKHCGKKKARNCCNGRPLKKYGVDAACHFAACITQTGMKLFTAISAMKNCIMVGADALKAYA